MLIIPLTGKLSKRNLPIITMIIILINIAVYFTVQSQDNQYYEKARRIYLDSGLSEIEVGYYMSYREGKKTESTSGQSVLGEKEREKYLVEMMNDDKFQRQLTSGKIINSGDPQYEKWRELRNEYDSTIGKVMAWQYGFIPAKHKVETLISHMFLHGSFMHLLGNMVFLWLVGCVLELGFGRLNYIIIYLLGGVFAVGLFYVFNMNSTIPLIGASGAISGLMGAYTVAYGKTKINVFYSLGFYFNYTRVYAILLLPLWLVSEALQLILTESNVAYLAHIGGLGGGAILGIANMKLFKRDEHKVFEEDPKEKIKPLLEQALGKIETLDMKAARSLLIEVLAIDPANHDALKHLYNIDKIQPQLPQFHETAAKRLTALCRETGSEKVLIETFLEYCRLAGKPQIKAELLLHIGRVFAKLGKMDEAEAIIGYVFSMTPNHPRLISTLMEVVNICDEKGYHDCCEHYKRLLLDHFPGSPEALMVEKMRN